MTRNEFINEVCSWEDLVDFCYDYGCDVCDGIHDLEDRNDLLNERLQEKAGEVDCWQDLLEWLGNIPTGYDYYYEEGYYEFVPVDDDDFDDCKDEALEWADDRDIWDEEETEEDEESPATADNDENINDDFAAEDEPISIGELMIACNSQMQQIN